MNNQEHNTIGSKSANRLVSSWRRAPVAVAVAAVLSVSAPSMAATQADSPMPLRTQAVQLLASNSVYVIDAGVTEADAIRKQIPASATVIELSAFESGIEQISAALKGMSGVDAVHIVSHGGEGYLRLGSDVLSGDTLAWHSEQLKAWQASLSDKADLMLYGCDVAASAEGVALLDELKTLTGADVAASTNPTGNATKGGDWQLEHQRGAIESAGLNVPAFPGTLATITVDGSGCTFEQAVYSAGYNGVYGTCAVGDDVNDTIVFDPALVAGGSYTVNLTQEQKIPFGATGGVTIDGDADGDGFGDVILDAGNAYRHFAVRSSGAAVSSLTLNNLTLQNGYGGRGGSIHSYGDVTVDNCVFSNNYSYNNGGAIGMRANSANLIYPTLRVSNSTFDGNTAPYGNGGAINNWNGAAVIVTGSTFTNNYAYYGAISNAGQLAGNGQLFVGNSTFSGNSGYGATAIQSYGGSANAVLRNNTFANNTSTDPAPDWGFTVYGFTGTVSAYNNIFADSNAQTTNCYVGTLTAGADNMSTDNTCGTSTAVTLADLKLDTLADNGGPTQTVMLLSGSVAIDAGTDAFALDDQGVALATDQRGQARISGTVDVGAFERQPTDSDPVAAAPATGDTTAATTGGGGATGPFALLLGLLGLFMRGLRRREK